MKYLPTKILLILSAMALSSFLLLNTGCETPGDSGEPARPCVVDSDCYETEVCVDEVCTACKCKEMGGTCTLRTDSCAGDEFDWSTLGCPGGREEKCCLPKGSCSAVGGTCEDWDSTCPEGTGAYGSMDCPDGHYDQCCIPVR
jgi:hypothetical protein